MISAEFAQAIKNTKDADIAAVCSRSTKSAQKFIQENKLNATAYDSVEEMCADPKIDAVYVASPNSLHASHALTAIHAGKHVVIEKPAAWNPTQWDQIWGAAQEADVLVFEAARHIHEPAQRVIRDYLVGKKPKTVRLNYSQYSSRWDAVEAGEEPNVFSLTTGGGALNDLGIYPVYDAVLWFGEPDGVKYFPSLAPTGVDAAGTMVMIYKDFNVIITVAKNAQSDAPSEILVGKETLRLSSVQGIDRVIEYTSDSQETLYDSEVAVGSRSLHELMRYEAKYFVKTITAKMEGTLSDRKLEKYRSFTLLSRSVNEICANARYGAGIFFESEVHELY